MPAVSTELREDVAIVRIDRPPVNAIDLPTQSELQAGLGAALADRAVCAVVLTGTSRAFSAGADISEFDHPPSSPTSTLAAVIHQLEEATKPVVAAIDGVCLGGGFELALGCHFRLASPVARFGLPEVKLGIVPGSGGTQRLARAIGLEAALPIVLSGDTFTAERAFALGVVQQCAPEVIGAAVAFARAAAERDERPRLRDAHVALPRGTSAHALIESARAALRHPLAANLAVLECLEAAATLPFDEGLDFEWRSFLSLVGSSESRAQRYLFKSERAAARIPALASGAATRRIARVAVVGAGTMGSGITMCAVNAGLPVLLIEQNAAALERGLATIDRHYTGSVEKGRIDASEARQRRALISATLDPGLAADVDLVIEAVFEDLAVKQGVLRQLDAILHPGAILASNTSTLDLDRLAAVTHRPQQVVGLHFFSPAHVMRLLEVVRGKATSIETLATALAFARQIGKVGVVAGVCDGFIGNRLFEEYLRQAYYLLEEGALPWDVDRALEAWGMAMGPFAVMDLAGNDIGWAIRRRRATEAAQRAYSRIPDLICERGRFGQKSGAGFYRYDPQTRRRSPDLEVEALIREERRTLGLSGRAISDEEMVSRCILALTNEGARVVADGIAYRASDVDVVYVNGYGFPRHRGGPMWYADECGLAAVLATMAELRKGWHGECWEPAPLLVEVEARGARLTPAS